MAHRANSPAPPIDFQSLVRQKGRAVHHGGPDAIRAANHALNAAHIERAIRENLAKDDGITDEDRERLCALLHGGW